MVRALLAIIFSLVISFAATHAQESLAPDQNASVDTLISEAQSLFLEKRPLDARAKLQQALLVDPEDYRPHFYLGVYYLSEVGHFQLADRYLAKAEELFRNEYGSEEDGTLKPEAWAQNARIIQYRSEARLNLDDYAGALNYVDRFGRTYWDDWYPGSKAWILMKLRRVDEAIQIAQMGILRGADETRTYNILGILYSLKGNRRLAIQAFAQAIQAELRLGGMSQAATPLNNAGEVYNEMFQDGMAEAAWLRALRLPDGCDHVLPSLNLATLYMNELRLFQAERTLSDFEACFALRSQRSDTEHRSLLALARGKILLHQGEVEKALPLLEQAADRQQWYGKIGTNPDDLKFAAAQALSLAYDAAAEYLRDSPEQTLDEYVRNRAQSLSLRVKSWWQARRAREIGVRDLENFEDLYIRNTDSMLEYAALGQIFRGVSPEKIRGKIRSIKEKDSRPEAHVFYESILLEAQIESERFLRVSLKTIQELKTLLRETRKRDRLLRARMLANLVRALESRDGLFFRLTEEEYALLRDTQEELFELLPSMLRQFGSALPVRVSTDNSELSNRLLSQLLRYRFKPGGNRYELRVRSSGSEITVTLYDSARSLTVVSLREPAEDTRDARKKLLTEFLDKCFGYRVDAPPEPLPRLEIISD